MNVSTMRYRPIIGGIFGAGTYSLATRAAVVNGLHAVEHYVIDPRAGVVLSSGATKLEALAAARHALRLLGLAANDEQWQQQPLFAEWQLPVPTTARAAKVASISRRRRRVFESSGGRCVYCARPLTLDGRWHVEHAMPRALGGGDGAGNLVASCAPCNLSKRDRTAIEFITSERGPT